MLTFESPVYDFGGIVVFRDHESPSNYYYLSGPPHLTRTADGPEFTMLTYRTAVSGTSVSALTRDQLGGAFLTLGVDCGLSPVTIATITSELSGLAPPGTGDIILTPVTYTRGSVNIIALDYQQPQAPDPGSATPTATAIVPPGTPPPPATQLPPGTTPAEQQESRFVRGVIGTAVPSLMDDLHASFSLSLTPDAAVLLENAYADDLSPIGVMYELQFAGLRPALSVKAHGDKKKIYDHLKLAFHAGYTSGSAAASAPATQPRSQATQPATRQTTTTARTGAGTAGTTTGTTTSGTTGTPATGGGTTTGTPSASGTTTASGTAPTSGATTPATTQGTTTASTGTGATGSGATGSGATGTQTAGTQTAGTQTAGTQTAGTQTSTNQAQQPGSTSVALAVDIGYEVEKMVQDQTITIEIVKQVTDQSVDSLQTAALDLIKQMITQEFFTPQMSNVAAPAMSAASQFSGLTAPAGAGSAGAAGRSGGRVEVGFQLAYKHEDELDTFDIDYSVAAPEIRTHAPNGFFSALLSDADKATHIREIDLDDPFFRRIDVSVTCTGDLAGYDVQSAAVDLQHGGTVDAPVVAGAVAFTPANLTGQHFTAFPDAGDYGVRHRTTYELGGSVDIAAPEDATKIVTDWVTDTSRQLVVHPADDMGIRSVFVQPGVVDWDVVDKVETTLTYDDPANSFTASKTFLVTSASPRVQWRVRLSDRSLTTYTVQHHWHLKDGARVLESKPDVVDLDEVFVPDPFNARLPIIVNTPVDRSVVSRVDVEIEYADPANDFTVSKIVTVPGPDFVPVRVSVPVLDPEVVRFAYTATLVKINQPPERLARVVTKDPDVYIVDDHTLVVVVTVLGGLAAAGIAGVQVDLRATPPAGQPADPKSVLFQPGDPAQQTVQLSADPANGSRYEYQTTAFLASGTVVIPWRSYDESHLTLLAAQLTSQPDMQP